MDAFKPEQRIEMVEHELQKQRVDYEGLVDRLRDENYNLTSKLKSLEVEKSALTQRVIAQSNQITNQNEMHVGRVNELEAKNAKLEEINQKLTATMNDLSLKNKGFVEEDNADMITESKKRQWCAACGKPGGRYYCNNQCEEDFW